MWISSTEVEIFAYSDFYEGGVPVCPVGNIVFPLSPTSAGGGEVGWAPPYIYILLDPNIDIYIYK
jgi:hypothetical protein